MPPLCRALGALVLLASSALVAAAPAPATPAAPTASAEPAYAPVDRPGPKLSVAPRLLTRSLHCSDGFDRKREDPVLLVSGTFTDPRNNYAWNYAPYFDSLEIPWCWVTVPDESTGDIQVAAEYIVHAIRRMHARSGDEISILGHSQGGMSPRWALRFWPDTRAMVDDLIGMAPSNHGSDRGGSGGADGGYAATFQQTAGSNFLKALNSKQETFDGIDYTVIVTEYDEVVTPYRSSFLTRAGGRLTNIAVQDLCPANTSEHLAIGTVDAVAAALVVDALDRPGPASPQAVPATVCSEPFQPGVSPANGAQLLADFAAMVQQQATILEGEFVQAEPALRCYVFARGCRSGSGGGADDPATAPQGGGSGGGGDGGTVSPPGGSADGAAARVPTSFPAGVDGDDDGPPTGPLLLGLLGVAVAAGMLRTARMRRASRVSPRG